MTRLLFVCHGNICRSPAAESIFRHLVRERGVEHLFEVDSAGTSSYHRGDPPDPRTVEAGRERGIAVAGSSRPVVDADLLEFDYVIAMDADNLAWLERVLVRARGTARLHRLREWDPSGAGLNVPDPYYGGTRGFAEVQEIVERSCAALLEHLLAEMP